ncbi:MAG: hypothetical protein JRJ41_02475 [Deltaproteobacteria bacterium]|nr:hypothetical protein [Deltaproteobacteria bacterium]
MSKQYPECPLANHANCKDLYTPKLCAMARKDKKCLKKNPEPSMKKKKMEGAHSEKNK